MSIYRTAQASSAERESLVLPTGFRAGMSVLGSIAASLLGALVDTSQAEEEAPYALKDVSGIEVRLQVPWTNLMAGERLSFEFILSNASDKPIPVAIPLKKYGFGWPVGGQPYLEPQWSLGHDQPLLEVRTAQWPPEGLDEGMGPPGIEAWGNLQPGCRLRWNESRLPGDYFGAQALVGIESITARWLAGPQMWISSETVPLRIVRVPSSERKEVFTVKWSSYGYDKDSRSGTAFVAGIDGRSFLFFERYRLAEVFPGDQFEHQIDEHGTNLGITIRGKAGVRKVYYHLRQGLTRDTPWPIGPVSLLYPKPEPIPPAELAALRARLLPPEDEPPVSGGPTRREGDVRPVKAPPAPGAGITTNPTAAGRPGIRLWIGLLIIVTCGGIPAWLIFARKKRESSRR